MHLLNIIQQRLLDIQILVFVTTHVRGLIPSTLPNKVSSHLLRFHLDGLFHVDGIRIEPPETNCPSARLTHLDVPLVSHVFDMETARMGE